MERLQLNVPDMYADHHVLKVRAVLGALAPQVQNVVASSAFRVVALDFDPAATSAEAIQGALAEAGYPAAGQPGAINPVVPVQNGQTDPAWDRLGQRISKTDARDTKTAR
ncbi:MAG TPA: heavy-metal-associated domain-containing protein [Anaerolineae bacterium]